MICIDIAFSLSLSLSLSPALSPEGSFLVCELAVRRAAVAAGLRRRSRAEIIVLSEIMCIVSDICVLLEIRVMRTITK